MDAHSPGLRVLVVFLGLALVALPASALAAPPAPTSPALADDPDLDGLQGVREAPADPQPAIPSVLVATGRLLIDRSHNEYFDVGGFTGFLASHGWVIAENSAAPITDSTLQVQDILLIPTRSIYSTMTPFSPAEVAAIQSFLAGGKGLWVLSDNVDPSAVNTLATAFGVTFRYDFVQDPSNNEGVSFWPTIYMFAEHPIIGTIESYGYYLGDCLTVGSPSEAIARADGDSYSLYCPAGSYPPTLAAWSAAGRAVFSGDVTPLSPSYFPSRLREEEQLLRQNIVNWLIGAPPTATSPRSWGSVKALYGASPSDDSRLEERQ